MVTHKPNDTDFKHQSSEPGFKGGQDAQDEHRKDTTAAPLILIIS